MPNEKENASLYFHGKFILENGKITILEITQIEEAQQKIHAMEDVAQYKISPRHKDEKPMPLECLLFNLHNRSRYIKERKASELRKNTGQNDKVSRPTQKIFPEYLKRNIKNKDLGSNVSEYLFHLNHLPL